MHQVEGNLEEKRAFKKKYSLDGVSLNNPNAGLSDSYYTGLATTGSINMNYFYYSLFHFSKYIAGIVPS